MKKIVFDLDDTLWNLNERACEITGVDLNKLDVFKIHQNTHLTKEEIDILFEVYKSPSLWDNIKYCPGATSIKDLESDDVQVLINSNCLNEDVKAKKRSFLSKDLGLPDDQIILNVANHKNIEDVFIFVDDNPANIMNSKATWNIMPDKLWNQGFEGKNVIRCYSLEEIIDTIKHLLEE